MEHSIVINSSGGISLEGKIRETSGRKAAVICHPHPLYGGNMDNPVVTAAEEAFFNMGYSTLRFNFRGAGKSSGVFDDGTGEQEDVKAVVSKLREMGYDQVVLAGYSFGSRINAAVVSGGECRVEDHIMISPPAAFMSFADIQVLPYTGLIITGSHDEIAPPELIEKHIDRWGINPKFEIIPDGDHFYSTSLGKLKGILEAYLS